MLLNLLFLASFAVADFNITILNVTISPKSVPYAEAGVIHVEYSVFIPASLAGNKTLDTIVNVCAPSIVGAGCMSSKGHHFQELGDHSFDIKISSDNAWWMPQGGDLPPGKYELGLYVCDGKCIGPKKKVKVLAASFAHFEVTQ
jgi:hypothetical protein